MTVPGPGSSSNAARKAVPCRTAAAAAGWAVAVAEAAGVGVVAVVVAGADVYAALTKVLFFLSARCHAAMLRNFHTDI
jgi:hypothetical protein